MIICSKAGIFFTVFFWALWAFLSDRKTLIGSIWLYKNYQSERRTDNDVSMLESKTNYVDVDKLMTVPADLIKLKNDLGNDVVKNNCM